MIPIDWVGVSSSNIKAVRYSPETRELYVHFNSGKMYTYYDVPVDIAEGITHAGSATQYLNQYIKGVYAFTVSNA
jgi:hypothetical protein